MPKRTIKQIRFEATLNRLLKQANSLDKKGVRGSFRILKEANERILKTIAFEALEGWDTVHLPRILNAVNDVVNQYRVQYDTYFTQLQNEGFDFGQLFTDDLAAVSGGASAELTLSTLPALSTDTLAIWQGYSSKLIANITEDMRSSIDSILTTGITGEKSPSEVMKEIGRLPNFKQVTENQLPYKKIKGSPTQKAWVRAETITRTELHRVQNLAIEARQEQIFEKYPKSKKYWMQVNTHNPRLNHKAIDSATNPNNGGKPIDINKKYILVSKKGTAYKVTGPQAPNLPVGEVANCSCRNITVLVLDEE